MPTPIALFAFNRPEHLQRVLVALAKNALADASSLTIFCDGPRHEQDEAGTAAVRQLARQARGFAAVEVVERPRNMGCAASVIDGLTQMFSQYERCIVIEDDILCSPYTLAFLNAGLERYETAPVVWNISAWSPPPSIFPVPANYPYDVYAIPRFNCWGWASWRDRFIGIDWDVSDFAAFASNPWLHRAFNHGGDDLTPMLVNQMQGAINSWAIRSDYTRYRRGCVGINPVRSYTFNIGMGSGTHTTTLTHRFDTDIAAALPPTLKFRWLEHIFVDESLRKAYCQAFCPADSLSPPAEEAFQQGKREGIQEGWRLVVRTMAALHIPEERISRLTGIEPGIVHTLIRLN